jgi:hypothetical protein
MSRHGCRKNKWRRAAVSLGGFGNFDYTILLCSKMEETHAFYRDLMQFPIETERANWVSFRVGVSLLPLGPRGRWSVCDDGPSISGTGSGSARVSGRAAGSRCLPCGIGRQRRAHSQGADRSARLAPPHAVLARSPRATSSRSMLSTDGRCASQARRMPRNGAKRASQFHKDVVPQGRIDAIVSLSKPRRILSAGIGDYDRWKCCTSAGLAP